MIIKDSVFPCSCGGGWRGSVIKGDKCFELGTFGDKEEASRACTNLKDEFTKLEKKSTQTILKPLNPRNTSGVTGVCLNRNKKVWRVDIHVNNKNKWVGSYKTKRAAVRARRKAEIEYGYKGVSTAQVYLDEQ